MIDLWLNRLKRATRRSPGELLRRFGHERRALTDRLRGAPSAQLGPRGLAVTFDATGIDELWQRIAMGSHPVFHDSLPAAELDKIIPGESARILDAAEQAMRGQVDLLGSGPRALGDRIDWYTDFKNDVTWPPAFFRDIDILKPGTVCDVKVPWDLSRLQWAIPVAQAYQLTGDDTYAVFVRDLIGDWITANPYARSVNWAVAMEAAMRVFTWTWFFHVFKGSTAWRDEQFQTQFLCGLYDHAVFCERYLEDFGINGNHLTADAAALVFAGEFFEKGDRAILWEQRGWRILVQENFRQVHPDGVDFEGSASYHRMVAELFLWPALYRRVNGKGAPETYLQRVRLMGEFARAYTRDNGLSPLWGDADDGRAYIFGVQPFADHSYLPLLVSKSLGGSSSSSSSVSTTARVELIWGLGPERAGAALDAGPHQPFTTAFPAGGVYVMRGEGDWVFIDCGPVGYGGRGGHGHNDCLSFEAALNGVDLITDSGSFVYSESREWRNLFRSTASHSTPMIDGAEQNRFVSEDELFALHDDAAPLVNQWRTGDGLDVFTGSHTGYQRLGRPVTPVRTLALDKQTHGLLIADRFDGEGSHDVFVPYHFAPGFVASPAKDQQWRVASSDAVFLLYIVEAGDWTADVGEGWVSASYGVKQARQKLMFDRQGELKPLTIAIWPEAHAPADKEAWIREMMAKSAEDQN